MGPEEPNKLEGAHLLEDIAETVRSIDRTVDEILDRLRDHFDERDWYSKGWCGHGYNLSPEHDDDTSA